MRANHRGHDPARTRQTRKISNAPELRGRSGRLTVSSANSGAPTYRLGAHAIDPAIAVIARAGSSRSKLPGTSSSSEARPAVAPYDLRACPIAEHDRSGQPNDRRDPEARQRSPRQAPHPTVLRRAPTTHGDRDPHRRARRMIRRARPRRANTAITVAAARDRSRFASARREPARSPNRATAAVRVPEVAPRTAALANKPVGRDQARRRSAHRPRSRRAASPTARRRTPPTTSAARASRSSARGVAASQHHRIRRTMAQFRERAVRRARCLPPCRQCTAYATAPAAP